MCHTSCKLSSARIEYTYNISPERGFAASLVRTVSFASVLIGFSEDFVRLDDGRYLISDAVLGSIWVAQQDGTISPGIVPKSFNLGDLIPTLAFGPTMPEITVNGYPFLFTGSNDAVSQTSFNLPFIVSKILIRP
jgi:hypothetical protein